MNEQTEPQQPHDGAARADDPTPRDPAPYDPARPADATAADERTARIDGAPAADGDVPRRGRGVLKPVLIGSAAAATVLAVAVGGLAIADAVEGDDDEPRPEATATAPLDPSSASPEPSASAAPSAAAEPSATPEPGTGASGAPDDLVAAIETAIAAAGGGAATGIEVDRDAWKVDVRLDDGSELDVRVPVAGEAIVQSDDDDRSNDLPLETGRITEINAAAIGAAGGGEVRSIETDDDEVRFEVEVVLGDEEIDVDLADDLAVLAVDR